MALTQVAGMSAMRIVDRLAHQTRPYRIQMNVAHQLQQITIGIHQQSLIATLKQMASPVLGFVHVACVAERQVVQPLR